MFKQIAYQILIMALFMPALSLGADVLRVKGDRIAFSNSRSKPYRRGDIVNIYSSGRMVGTGMVSSTRQGLVVARVKDGIAERGDQVYGVFRVPSSMYAHALNSETEFMWSRKNKAMVKVSYLEEVLEAEDESKNRSDIGNGLDVSFQYDFYLYSWISTSTTFGGRFVEYKELEDSSGIYSYEDDESLETRDIYLKQTLNVDIDITSNFILRPYVGITGSTGRLEYVSETGDSTDNSYFRYGTLYGASAIIYQKFVPFVQWEMSNGEYGKVVTKENQEDLSDQPEVLGKQKINSLSLGLGVSF
jgi:hypothetical protein